MSLCSTQITCYPHANEPAEPASDPGCWTPPAPASGEGTRLGARVAALASPRPPTSRPSVPPLQPEAPRRSHPPAPGGPPPPGLAPGLSPRDGRAGPQEAALRGSGAVGTPGPCEPVSGLPGPPRPARRSPRRGLRSRGGPPTPLPASRAPSRLSRVRIRKSLFVPRPGLPQPWVAGDSPQRGVSPKPLLALRGPKAGPEVGTRAHSPPPPPPPASSGGWEAQWKLDPEGRDSAWGDLRSWVSVARPIPLPGCSRPAGGKGGACSGGEGTGRLAPARRPLELPSFWGPCQVPGLESW